MVARVQEYSHEQFDNLCAPGVSYKKFMNHNVEPVIRDKISKVFTKHKAEHDFAVALLHRHCNLASDQRLVKVRGVMLPWSSVLRTIVEPSLGKIYPHSLLIHDGKYYPYEFIHVSLAELKASPNECDARLESHSEFMKDFASVVQEENIADIIGLRLLSDEEKKIAADPNTQRYEVNDSGDLDCVAITLTAGPELASHIGSLEVSWVFSSGKMTVLDGCLWASGHREPGPGDYTECDASGKMTVLDGCLWASGHSEPGPGDYTKCDASGKMTVLDGCLWASGHREPGPGDCTECDASGCTTCGVKLKEVTL